MVSTICWRVFSWRKCIFAARMVDTTRYPVPAGRCRAEETVDRSRLICDLARAATPADAQAFGREIQAKSSPCVEFATLRVVLTWTCLSAVRHLLPSFEAVADSEDFGEQVTLGLRVTREHLDRLRAALGNATSGQAIFPDDARPSA